MNRRHALIIALGLGVAAVAGTFAAIQTTTLGAEAGTVSPAQIQARERQLDRAERKLRRQARRRPPAVPSSGAQGATRVVAAAAPAFAPSPASGRLVVWSSGPSVDAGRSHHHGEDEDEHEHEFEDHDDDGHGHGRGRGRGRGGDDFGDDD